MSTAPSTPPATTPTPAPKARIAFVGSGPGDPGLMTVRATKLLKLADVVVADEGTLRGDYAEWLAEDTEFVTVPGSQAELTAAARAKELVQTAKKAAKAASDQRAEAGHVLEAEALVVRIVSGDPSIFSSLGVEAAVARKAGLEIEVVPGVSALLAVPAYAGFPIAADTNSVVHAVGPGGRFNPALVDDEDTTLVFYGSPAEILDHAAALVEAGKSEDCQIALTSGGTTTHQATIVSTLGTVEQDLKGLEDEQLVATLGTCLANRQTLSWFETRPLFAWRVLVPRTKDQAGPMVSALAERGASAHVVPTISVEPPRSPHQMDKAIKGLVTGRYEWIGFTSVNAVKAVREKFTALGLDGRAFSGLKIAAVGGKTAGALRRWGLEPDLLPTGEQSARGLLEVWPPYDDVLDPIDRVFLPRADIATEVLVNGLQERGWEVDDIVAYRTVRATPPPAPIRAAIKAGDYDAVLFTSSSTVRNLVGIAGKPSPSTVVIAIGPATARTAEDLGLRVDAVAAEASSEAVIAALTDFARQRAETAVAEGRAVTRPSQEAPKRRSRR
ncbi:uroporphyrinogen III methyltransferase / synthase [Kytococcus aerolatus]|uniref:uroporphyrinogen-III C-methyltransferase n=1 Tax=Kytococcus aerolatus TaxID=592308 RepID=A0A212TCX8_9MICO|nr:uroporphyrinogen-III synthase [Kytococcus aerolatus]SNC63918.1 uroporphyrinogen III methyltransferase / synthase [Kytococcus aerolatus]